jgi:uncharacterized protein YggE
MTRRTVTVTATGRSETVPELTTVEVDATGEGDSATVARDRARDRAATIRAALRVEDERIRTVDRRVRDASDLLGEYPDAAYWAVQTLHVDCVAETAGAVVVDATDAGGHVESVDFALHDETTRRLRDEALDAAMERAGRKAERIAAAEGLRVGEVSSVTTVEETTETSSLVDEALATGHDADFEPDPIVVSETVEVTYGLDD